MDMDRYENQAEIIDDLMSVMATRINNAKDDEIYNEVQIFDKIAGASISNANVLLEAERNQLEFKKIESNAEVEKAKDETNRYGIDVNAEIEGEKNSTNRYGIDVNTKIEMVKDDTKRYEIDTNAKVEKEKAKSAFGAALVDAGKAFATSLLGILGIAMVCAFEKSDDGGIINSKVLSPIFKLIK